MCKTCSSYILAVGQQSIIFSKTYLANTLFVVNLENFILEFFFLTVVGKYLLSEEIIS